MRLVLAGGSGMIGKAVLREFEGEEIVVLSRSSRPVAGARVVPWDGRTVGAWGAELEVADVVVNLAGERLDRKWTPENRRLIVDSRVEPTEAIGAAIARCVTPPSVWINASAVGYYGDTGERLVDESAPAGTGFMAEACVAWEAAVERYETPRTRRVRLRIGVVLGRESGALPVLARLARRFVGGAAGSGAQWVSWASEEDVARAVRWAVERNVAGAVNVVSPEPVRNRDLMAALRRVLRRPWAPPAPAWALRLYGGLAGPDPELLLISTRVASARLRENGFEWRDPELEPALRQLLDSDRR